MNDMYYGVKIKPYILDLKLRNLVRTFPQQMTTIDSHMNLKLNSMILKCHEIQSQYEFMCLPISIWTKPDPCWHKFYKEMKATL